LPIADWTVPFDLRSLVYTNNHEPGGTFTDPLPINTVATFPSGTGFYLLREDGCSLANQVRSTKDFVPQEDGAILHRRFTGGMEMTLAIQMWQNKSKIACDELLQEMKDTLMGYLYGLLNAGDNDGRIRWAPTGGTSGAPGSNGYRMLDDIRLLTYPAETHQPGSPYEIGVTIDCDLPYAQDETQLTVSLSGAVINYGNRPAYPVWQITADAFTLTNTTTNESFSFDDGLPGCPPVGGGYVEIDTFHNSATIVNVGPVYDNAAAGIDMTGSDFFLIVPGSNAITLNAGSGACLINAAWA
jgi:hypothetical protein